MGYQGVQPSSVWALAARQHGVVKRGQLLELGLGPQGIKHRVRKGRLHPVHRGVYAVGRPELTRQGRWMAAVLSCGPGAALSHASAACAMGIRIPESRGIEVSVPDHRRASRPSIVVHRRAWLSADDVTAFDGIPVTWIVCTLVDLALRLTPRRLEVAVNEAVNLDLTDPEAVRAALDRFGGRPGVAKLRETLDRRTFLLTDSDLERRFLPLVRKAGLPLPETRRFSNGYRVDFRWPDLGLVVETDSLRFHRTPAQQTADRLRDQAHTASGLTNLRFTHAQVRYTPDHVERTLSRVARRLARAAG
jgi:very-short-patch-repair endonuclease